MSSSILLKINFNHKDELTLKILNNILTEIKNTIKKDLGKNENVFFNYDVNSL